MLGGGRDEKISFADINLASVSIRGEPHNPGAGGWPTIRYFNKDTGVDGESYDKRTEKSVCDELGDDHMMLDYVERVGKTVLCDQDGKNCSDKEKLYIEKKRNVKDVDELEDEMERLQGLLANGLSGELKEWNFRRQRILRQFITNLKDRDEL